MFLAIQDSKLALLYGGVLFLLLISTLIGQSLRSRRKTDSSRSTIDNLNARIRAWWKMCAIFAVAVMVGRTGALVLFAVISFLAMREYMTLVTSSASSGTACWPL